MRYINLHFTYLLTYLLTTANKQYASEAEIQGYQILTDKKFLDFFRTFQDHYNVAPRPSRRPPTQINIKTNSSYLHKQCNPMHTVFITISLLSLTNSRAYSDRVRIILAIAQYSLVKAG